MGIESFKKINTRLPALFYIVIFIGIILSINQFFFNRSLWYDEASLAISIVNRNFAELLKPLDLHQVAPIGFLYIEKFSVLLFGKNELALRIFPLVSFLTSIFLFFSFLKKMFKESVIPLIATSIFSISFTAILYSSDVKQYSSDTLFGLIILYASIFLRPNKNASLFVYAIVGSIVIWFSNSSIIVLFVVGNYFLYKEFYANKNRKIILPILMWLVSFCIYFYFFIYEHPASELMKNYWQNSFLPLNPFSSDFFIFLFSVFQILFGFLLGFHIFWFVPLTIYIIAVFALVKQKRYTILYFCLAPIIVHLILSGFEMYPFATRLLLYVLPLVIIIFSYGLKVIFDFINKNIVLLPKVTLLLPVFIMFIPFFVRYPIQREEIRQSLNYIEDNINESEGIYVYHGADRAFNFYRESGIVQLNNKAVFGHYHVGESYKYNSELTSLKGKVWVLFSHVSIGLDKNLDEEKYIINYLVNIGGKLLDVKKYYRSSVYYIDTQKKLKNN